VRTLLSGFGYDLGDARNKARANDQLVRAHVAGLLAEAAQALATLEQRYREAHVPPSTRENPFPPADAMKGLKLLDGLRKRTGALSSTVLTLEAPGNDRIWQRLRDERTLLERLLAADIGLVAAAQDLVDAAKALGPDAVRKHDVASVETAAAEADEAIAARRALLFSPI
jgi:hypothetical protein